jgi:hypothetical protein
MRFAHEDRLTRAEAEQVINWAQSNPEVMAAYASREHPGHAEIMAFSEMAFMFAHEFPTNEAGEPLGWDQVEAAGAAVSEAEPDEIGDFNKLTPGQAAARVEAAYHDPKYEEWRIAIRDRSHPDHDLAVREMARLTEIAGDALWNPDWDDAAGGTVTDAAGDPALAGGVAGSPSDQAAARKRIDDDFYGNPDFMKRYTSPVREIRQAAIAEMSAAFEAAYPEPPPKGDAVPPVVGTGASKPVMAPSVVGKTIDASAARQRIDQLYGDADFMKRYASPVREVKEAAMAEMSAAFEAAYPEPAPDAGTGDGTAA